MKNIIQQNISVCQKIIKYITIGLIVMVATYYIPDVRLLTNEIIMIAATSSITYAILDMISPAIIINKSKSINEVLVEK